MHAHESPRLLLAHISPADGSPGKPPNILFIFTDDQSWRTVGCYRPDGAWPFVQTPHIDRLAAEGVRFTHAYGAFMFALLVCQKQSMWTIMVYIYQLQQTYNVPIIFAALVIAAVPTLIVFTLCQNIIMRGIVVPVEK